MSRHTISTRQLQDDIAHKRSADAALRWRESFGRADTSASHEWTDWDGEDADDRQQSVAAVLVPLA